MWVDVQEVGGQRHVLFPQQLPCLPRAVLLPLHPGHAPQPAWDLFSMPSLQPMPQRKSTEKIIITWSIPGHPFSHFLWDSDIINPMDMSITDCNLSLWFKAFPILHSVTYCSSSVSKKCVGGRICYLHLLNLQVAVMLAGAELRPLL